MDVRCEECKRTREKCKCTCHVCKINLFDKKRIFKVADIPVRIVMNHDGKRICDHCLKCFRCGKSVYSGGDMILHTGKFVAGIQEFRGRKKWFCGKSKCIDAVKTDPWTIATEKRLKEQKKERDLEDFSLTDAGTRAPVILCSKVKTLMCPELFGLDPDSNIVTNMMSCHRFSRMIYHVIYERFDEKNINFLKRTRIGELPETFRNYFEPSISAMQVSRKERRKSLERKAKARAQKYPNETPKATLTSDLTEKDVSIYAVPIILCSEQRSHMKTVNRKDLREVAQEDINNCMHFNATLWYYCGRILKDQSIDGFQDKLTGILKKWWDLGLYPIDRTDYLDITNLSIKSQLVREIKVVETNTNNRLDDNGQILDTDGDDLEFDETSECIICYGKFPKCLVELKPCGHKNYCKDCALKISKCSLCSTMISERIQSTSQ